MQGYQFYSATYRPIGDIQRHESVADPGFPVGGGDVDLRRGRFSMKMYVKMKELGPVGGHAPGTPPLDPPM